MSDEIKLDFLNDDDEIEDAVCIEDDENFEVVPVKKRADRKRKAIKKQEEAAEKAEETAEPEKTAGAAPAAAEAPAPEKSAGEIAEEPEEKPGAEEAASEAEEAAEDVAVEDAAAPEEVPAAVTSAESVESADTAEASAEDVDEPEDTPAEADAAEPAEAADTAEAGAEDVDEPEEPAADAAADRGPDLAMAVATGMITPAPAVKAAEKAAAPEAAPAEKPKKKSHKGLLIFLGLLLAAAGGTGIWAWNFWQEHHASTVFYDRTYLYGADVSGQSPDMIVSDILEKEDSIRICLTENGQVSAEGSARDFGLTLDEKKLSDSLNEALSEQTNSPKAAFGSLYQDAQIGTSEAWNLDEDVLNKKIDSRNLLVNREASFDAYLVFDEDERCAKIIPEVYGTRFDQEALNAYMKETLLSDFSEGNLSASSEYTIEFPEELYKKPSITKDDQELNDLCAAYNLFAGTDITYTFGAEHVNISFEELCGMLKTVKDKAIVRKEAVEKYVAALADKYDTRYKARTFTGTNGEVAEFADSQVEYGYTIDQEAETDQLYNDIINHAKINRNPIYDAEDKWGNPYFYSRNGVDDLYGTYVEVSLSDQHVWFYKGGELIVEGDCVTGNLKRKMGTSRGMYPITFKKSPATLRGGSGKSAYATPVTYWMPFNGGQGLHDATWRGKFGGNIYKTNGSHGCVNLPKKVAAAIYENCKPGMCVIVY